MCRSVCRFTEETTAYGGNLSGNLRRPQLWIAGMPGCQPGVLRLCRERSARGRRFARNGGCEPGANLLAASSARRVLIVRTGLRTSVGNLAPTGISRAFGCVRIVRERVRDGSFMGLVFSISVEWVGDRWEWSLLMVTANGHWLDAWLGAGLRSMLRVLTFANRWWIPAWIPETIRQFA